MIEARKTGVRFPQRPRLLACAATLGYRKSMSSGNTPNNREYAACSTTEHARLDVKALRANSACPAGAADLPCLPSAPL